jgi:hypothetical protein
MLILLVTITGYLLVAIDAYFIGDYYWLFIGGY